MGQEGRDNPFSGGVGKPAAKNSTNFQGGTKLSSKPRKGEEANGKKGGRPLKEEMALLLETKGMSSSGLRPRGGGRRRNGESQLAIGRGPAFGFIHQKK